MTKLDRAISKNLHLESLAEYYNSRNVTPNDLFNLLSKVIAITFFGVWYAPYLFHMDIPFHANESVDRPNMQGVDHRLYMARDS